MREQLLALYQLQETDIRIGQANAKLAALDGAKDLRRKYSAAKAALEAAEKALLAVETDLKDSELKLKTIDDKRNTFEKRLYSGAITNPKELGAIEKEVKMLKGQQSELDGRTLELMDAAEAARASAENGRKLLADAEAVARKAIAKEAALKKELEAELAELNATRDAEVANCTDKQLLSRYESVRKRTGGTGIAKVQDHKCGGCHVSITSFTSRKLFEDKEIVNCENCGRILLQEIA